jgi:hypothetical protein
VLSQRGFSLRDLLLWLLALSITFLLAAYVYVVSP